MHTVSRRKKYTYASEIIKEDLSFGEAFMMVWDLRNKKDGYYYWIGE